jgi:hypothetical protein
VWARFSAHVQIDPEAHPASCTMGTGSFPGVKRPGRGGEHPPLLGPRSGKSRAIPLPPSRPSGLLRGTFTFTFTSTPPTCLYVEKKKKNCTFMSIFQLHEVYLTTLSAAEFTDIGMEELPLNFNGKDTEGSDCGSI